MLAVCGEEVYNHLWEFNQQDRHEIENNSEWIIQIMDSLKDIKQQP
jgi:DNA/RNA-binding domain of Phe-tRNA-synthetase-like protein